LGGGKGFVKRRDPLIFGNAEDAAKEAAGVRGRSRSMRNASLSMHAAKLVRLLDVTRLSATMALA